MAGRGEKGAAILQKAFAKSILLAGRISAIKASDDQRELFRLELEGDWKGIAVGRAEEKRSRGKGNRRKP